VQTEVREPAARCEPPRQLRSAFGPQGGVLPQVQLLQRRRPRRQDPCGPAAFGPCQATGYQPGLSQRGVGWALLSRSGQALCAQAGVAPEVQALEAGGRL